jgi:hypothetical protein
MMRLETFRSLTFSSVPLTLKTFVLCLLDALDISQNFSELSYVLS